MNARSLRQEYEENNTLVMNERPIHPEKEEARALKRAIHLELVHGVPSVDAAAPGYGSGTFEVEQPQVLQTHPPVSFDHQPDDDDDDNDLSSAQSYRYQAPSPYRRIAIALAIGFAFVSGIAISFAMQMAAHPTLRERAPREAITRTESFLVSGPETSAEVKARARVRRNKLRGAAAAAAATTTTAADPTSAPAASEESADTEVDPAHRDLLGEGLK